MAEPSRVGATQIAPRLVASTGRRLPGCGASPEATVRGAHRQPPPRRGAAPAEHCRRKSPAGGDVGGKGEWPKAGQQRAQLNSARLSSAQHGSARHGCDGTAGVSGGAPGWEALGGAGVGGSGWGALLLFPGQHAVLGWAGKTGTGWAPRGPAARGAPGSAARTRPGAVVGKPSLRGAGWPF